MKILIKKTLISLLGLMLYSGSYALTLNSSAEIKKDTEELYKHLGNHIKYPIEANEAGLQGNNVILFTVMDGKLQDLKIETILGSSCDVEVLNNILSFSNFKNIKSGKYALKTTFKLEGSEKAMLNETAVTPDGYTALKMTITGYHATKSTVPNQDKKGKNEFKVYLNGAEPLYILDNEVFTADIKTISPDTIESISILKDLTAISLYGDQGKNGVVVITSKAASKKQTTQKTKDKQKR